MRSAAFAAVLLAAAASSADAETLRVKFDVTSLDGKKGEEGSFVMEAHSDWCGAGTDDGDLQLRSSGSRCAGRRSASRASRRWSTAISTRACASSASSTASWPSSCVRCCLLRHALPLGRCALTLRARALTQGIHGKPAIAAEWKEKTLTDDPVVECAPAFGRCAALSLEGARRRLISGCAGRTSGATSHLRRAARTRGLRRCSSSAPARRPPPSAPLPSFAASCCG